MVEDCGDDQWLDPLLITDASSFQQQVSQRPLCFFASAMADLLDVHSNVNGDVSCEDQSLKTIGSRNLNDPLEDCVSYGQSILGFSLASPDLVVCTGSPDIPVNSHGDSSTFSKNEFRKNPAPSIDISLEKGINGLETEGAHETQPAINSTLRHTPNEDVFLEASFELPPPPMAHESLVNEECQEEGLQVPTGETFACAIKYDSPPSIGEDGSLKLVDSSQMGEFELPEDNDGCEAGGDFQKLEKEYEVQKKELTETRRALEEMKRQNKLKTRECREAWKSLRELQNELMRKSMHVGSLAFAIEGQVKEKSKWFSSLRGLTRKLKVLKLEHINLSHEVSSYKKSLADLDAISSTVQSIMKQQMDSYESLKVKFIEGVKEQKELYNKILELKGNIRVFCRCRPLNGEEIAAGASMAIDFESARDGELTVKSNGALKKTFKFDAVFGPLANQADVFKDTTPFATSVLDGYNVCIFAYGQTGTGKTFTMEGTDEARGVNFRTLEELFHIIEERQQQFRYDISVSVLEVYNEQIRDLLVTGTQPGIVTRRLEIRQVGEGIHHVPGLVEAQVNNMSQVWEVLQTGSNARAVGSTTANEHSSRSHCIHCVMVRGENLLNGECTRSKLWLVDLAGSERVAKTEVQGERLKETQNINRSLSALGDVISSLATKSPHIPFRNSKLTHLLQDSLGGDSKTLMFVQISPNENDLSETLCSLNFASRVKGIELGPAKKQVDSYELLRYKQLVEKTKLDMKSKDVQIKKMEETIHGLDLKLKERDVKNRNLQDKVKELESQLLVERKLARQHVDTKIAEQLLLKQHQQQHEEQTIAMRPPLASRPLGSYKNVEEATSNDIVQTRPLSEKYNSCKPAPMDGFGRSMEKENNPAEVAEHQILIPPKRTGRASICTTARTIPVAPAPRRNSLIPLPSSAPSFLPLPIESDNKQDLDCLPLPHQQTAWNTSPKGAAIKVAGGEGKKLGNIMRRSLQKKIYIKSPMQHMRKGSGINVGLEKVRVSIGSRGRLAYRGMMLTNARRGAMQQKQQSHKDKERGWNSGTAVRT